MTIKLTIIELKKLRKKHKITQQQIGSKLEISRLKVSKIEALSVLVDIDFLMKFKKVYIELLNEKNIKITYDIEEVLYINYFESLNLKQKEKFIETLRIKGSGDKIIFLLDDYHQHFRSLKLIYSYCHSLYYKNMEFEKSLKILEANMSKLKKEDSTDLKFRYLNLFFLIYEQEKKDFFKAQIYLNEIAKLNLDETNKYKFYINQCYLYSQQNNIVELKKELVKIENFEVADSIESNRCLSELYLKIDKKKSKYFLEKALKNYNKENEKITSKIMLLKYLLQFYKLTNEKEYLTILRNKIIYNKKVPLENLKAITRNLISEYIENKEFEEIERLKDLI